MSFVYDNLIIGDKLVLGDNGQLIATTKGDLITNNGDKTIRFPVGSDNELLTADSTQSTGLLWKRLTKNDVGLDNVDNILNSYDKTTDPTVSDDSSSGYSVGSRWLNTTTGKEFVLVDDTVGAANWAGDAASLAAGSGISIVNNLINVENSDTILTNVNGVHVKSSDTPNQVLLSNGDSNTPAVYGAVPLNNAGSVTGTLPVSSGGTGSSSFGSADRIIITNATNDAAITSSLSPASVVTLTDNQSLSNKTITDVNISGDINDSSGSALITPVSVASSVNNLAISNAGAGSGPSISAIGSDSDIDLEITAKGAGSVIIGGNAMPNDNGSAGQALVSDGSGSLTFSDIPGPTISTITTTDATPTNVVSGAIQTVSDSVYYVDAKIVAIETLAGNNAASFVIRSTFHNNNGTLTKIADQKFYAPLSTEWDVSVSASGTNIVHTVTGGLLESVNWKLSMDVISA